jgi:hypothetical protein
MDKSIQLGITRSSLPEISRLASFATQAFTVIISALIDHWVSVTDRKS